VCKIEQSAKLARDMLFELGVDESRSWVMANSRAIREAQGRFIYLVASTYLQPSTFNAGLPEGSAFVRLGSERPLLGVIFPHSRSSSVTETASRRTQIIEKHRDREFCESLSGDLHKAVATLTDLVRLMRLNPTRVLG
jgi:hypothetical protein